MASSDFLKDLEARLKPFHLPPPETAKAIAAANKLHERGLSLDAVVMHGLKLEALVTAFQLEAVGATYLKLAYPDPQGTRAAGSATFMQGLQAVTDRNAKVLQELQELQGQLANQSHQLTDLSHQIDARSRQIDAQSRQIDDLRQGRHIHIKSH